MRWRPAQVEARLQFTRDDIRCAGASGEVGNLEGGWLEELVTTIPDARGEFRQRRGKRVYRVVRQLRVGHVALNAMDGEAAGEAAPAPVLDNIAEALLAGRLAYQAPVDGLATFLQPFDHPAGAIDTGAFLVAGHQPSDTALMVGAGGEKFLDGREHGRQAAFHVGGTTAVKQTVANGRLERVAMPFLEGAGRHHVGVASQTESGAAACHAAFPGSPEVVHGPEPEPFDLKPERFQAANHYVLAAFIRGAHRAATEQVQSQVEGGGHWFGFSRETRWG